MAIVIQGKIGTKCGTIIRVKGKRNFPKVGECIQGMPLNEYVSHSYPQYHLKEYFVTDISEGIYFLSL